MYLEYSHTVGGNFGDDLNPWLWPKLIPECLDENDGTALVGIGTILDQRRVERTLHKAKRIVVFSSGTGFSNPPIIDSKWTVYCVRGPYTAERLGLPAEKAIVDGAFLLRCVDLPEPKEKHAVSFMAHHGSEEFIDWYDICARAGVNYISPKQPVEDILRALRGTDRLITEAMHGAIVADALRIPWVPVKYSPKFMMEKWLDFSGALGLEITPSDLPEVYGLRIPFGKLVENVFKRRIAQFGLGPEKWQRLPGSFSLGTEADFEALADRLQQLCCSGEFLLSNDTVAERLTERLQEQLANLKNDYQRGILTA